MKKIFLTMCLLALSLFTVVHGEEPLATPFPNAKPGINIMPLNQIPMPSEMKKHVLKNKIAIASNKGYEDTTEMNKDIITLLSIERKAKDDIKEYGNDPNPLDTHLKSSPTKIPMSFNFKGIKDVDNVLGYAAAGGYNKAKGWDGLIQFVSDKNLGVCSYMTFKIEKVILDKETTEYTVNKKPTTKNIFGNWNTGFLYTVNWYTNDRIHTFQCANKTFKQTIMPKMLVIANKMDKS